MVLSTHQFKFALIEKLNASTQKVIIFSAFLKEDAVRWILDRTKAGNITIVTRWLPYDIVTGASDLSCYRICRDLGVNFGISSGLHGKVYYIDNHVLLGSSNATARGLALTKDYNDEFGTSYIASKTDDNNITNYMRSVTWVDDKLYSLIESDVLRMPPVRDVTQGWSEQVQLELEKPNNYIWVHELPFNEPSELQENYKIDSSSIDHDFELLGIDKGNFSVQQAIDAFRNSQAFSWCYNIVRESGALSFGEFTAKLHNAVLDDPTPYRREIKELTKVLFAWAKLYPSVFEIQRPTYREVIKLA